DDAELLLLARAVSALRLPRLVLRLGVRRAPLGALAEEQPVSLFELRLQILDLELQRRAVFALRLQERRRQLHHARDESAILRLEQARGLSQNFRILLALQIDHAARVMSDWTRVTPARTTREIQWRRGRQRNT